MGFTVPRYNNTGVKGYGQSGYIEYLFFESTIYVSHRTTNGHLLPAYDDIWYLIFCDSSRNFSCFCGGRSILLHTYNASFFLYNESHNEEVLVVITNHQFNRNMMVELVIRDYFYVFFGRNYNLSVTGTVCFFDYIN